MMNSQLQQYEFTLEDQIELAQRGDTELVNELILSYQPFIAKCVSEVCKRYVSKDQDEFSVGMIAFHDAIHLYSREKGASFLTFAQVIVKRKVIDYLRKENRQKVRTYLDQHEDDAELTDNPIMVSEARKIHALNQESWLRKQEILQLSAELREYKISFEELTEIAPKHKDARQSAMFAAKQLLNDEELKAYVLKKKRLPIKKLLKLVPVSKKTLERNRKYILTIFIILEGDYDYLREYIEGVK
ncbi:RNA polymerase sigma factor [Gracilibacillus halotolerans]|uniref:RNA polymerase sigma factor SigI n=1 Tax=Gracilibacillus halotolerans TaxID=74386 RepID=A0A841RMP9_9BACI|nr:RNA polymerase sigma-I factor [Gracilibacillus halotolerans]MBB6512716.1 RNA polymerase sigma factor [Gracilibacillus halotolerans]